MAQSPVAKIEKNDDFECQACSKTFPNETLFQTHVKTKHSQKPEPEKNIKPQSSNIKISNKSKGGFQQYQQDLQDKIFAFLGQLGEKNVINSDDLENNGQDSDKMIGQSNYLQNTIVKTPYEAQFDVVKIMNEIELPTALLPEELNKVFKQDVQVMWEKLSAERQRWQFCDPIQLYKYQNQQFTLVNIPSVIRNYKKKGITVEYPQLVIFALWLTKTCKSAAWKQLYAILTYTTAQYYEFRQRNNVSKDKTAWKNFNSQYQLKIQKDFPKTLLDQLNILKPEDILAFIKLYAKWVSYFGLE